jgi:hypothetical protein
MRILRWIVRVFSMCTLPLASAMSQDTVVYADALGNGWQNWSWATVNLASTNPVHAGQFAISMEPDDFEGLYFAGSVRSFADYTGLRLWVHGGAGSNQNLRLTFQLGQTVVFERPLNKSSAVVRSPPASGARCSSHSPVPALRSALSMA